LAPPALLVVDGTTELHVMVLTTTCNFLFTIGSLRSAGEKINPHTLQGFGRDAHRKSRFSAF